MRRLLWYAFRNHRRQLWRVYLTSHHWCPDLTDEGKRCDGVTVYAKRTIYVEVALPVREQDETANHEMLHAHAGPTPALSDVEESVIQRISPTYFPTCKRFGMRLPERPAGYRALAVAARRLDRALSEPLLADEEEA